MNKKALLYGVIGGLIAIAVVSRVPQVRSIVTGAA